MTVILGIAAAFIILGIIMCFGRKQIDSPILSKVVYYIGIVLIIVGLIFLLMPILIWVYDKLLEIFGAQQVRLK